MKRVGVQWRTSDQVAFFSYRWLAWIVAAVALTFPERAPGLLPRDAGLLLLISVMTVVATALAQPYVRLVRQRPAVLALDAAASAAIIWLSGSTILPFLPYALGALMLPALLFGVRGALLGAFCFAALDGFGLAVVNPATGAELVPLSLLGRLAAPFGLALCFVVVGRLFVHESSDATPQSLDPNAPGYSRSDGSERVVDQRGAGVRSGVASHSTTQATRSSSLLAPTPLLIARSSAEPKVEPPRRVLYHVPSAPSLGLDTVVEQLAVMATRQGGHEVHAALHGSPRPLTAAQQSVLLRVVQEALLNVHQHARATRAVVTLSYEPHAVTLSVEDNGVGLLDGTYERPGLHALRAVRYRLAELDGQLAVFEGENGGLTLRATVPLTVDE